MAQFASQPLTDYSLEANRSVQQEALAEFEARRAAGKLHACPIIGGTRVLTDNIVPSLDPSNPECVIGKVHMANESHVRQALEVLQRGQISWRNVPGEKRADILRTVAKNMRSAKKELAALVIREAGKAWKEADGELAEAIDFCDYYADEMTRLSVPLKMGQQLGEDNHYFYQPRGIALVVAPWNFPLAIACGMTVAALVTGNATILKPSGLTSIIGYELSRLLLDSGIPGDAFAFLPGPGGVLGDLLVKHPAVNVICFTGSKETGLNIIKEAAVVREGQVGVKRVVAEMGGKNAIIVDEDADLDDAVRGVLYSAFGYAGQKCSACSRVIAIGDSYETLMNRLCEAASNIIIGPAQQPEVYMGPVIDDKAKARIEGIIQEMEKQLKVAYKGTAPGGGYFVPPVIFRDVDPQSRLWREEVFGPVLACCQAKDFETALMLANDSEFALTGGVYSRSPKNIAAARAEFRVGNLYINRGTTGAVVGRQPFGGFKFSGVGSKAGGPDYLLQFLEPRTVTENTMRKGFTPELIG